MSAVRLAMLTLKTEDAKAPKITDTSQAGQSGLCPFGSSTTLGSSSIFTMPSNQAELLLPV